MPYFFRCDYCNDETDIQPWDIGDLSRNCNDCGQDMCIKCYGETDGLCDQCARDELKRMGEALQEREDEQ